MTTKLTEAELNALPPCKLCGKQPRTGVISGQIGCECVGWFYTPDKWRLLMTPEAKGEMTVEQTIYELRRAINRELDVDISTSYKLEEAQKEMAEARTIAAGRVAAYEATVKELRAQRDSLQSKLAKSEMERGVLKSNIVVMQEQLAETTKTLEGSKKNSQSYHDAIDLLDKTSVAARWEGPKADLPAFVAQLAEATKPVGDEELARAIAEIESRSGHFHAPTYKAFEALIRAARQRAQYVEFFGFGPLLIPKDCKYDVHGIEVEVKDKFLSITGIIAKPSGDAVKLAEMVKDSERLNQRSFREKYSGPSHELLQSIADSILAQAEAGETNPEILPWPCLKCGVCDGKHNLLVQTSAGKWEYPKNAAGNDQSHPPRLQNIKLSLQTPQLS